MRRKRDHSMSNKDDFNLWEGKLIFLLEGSKFKCFNGHISLFQSEVSVMHLSLPLHQSLMTGGNAHCL